MLKRFINLFSSEGSGAGSVIPRSKHAISNQNISRNAIKVIERLHQANYEAYLVGGGVRDLLLDGRPKDFDVATNATPEQVRKLFRSARIVGRRFRIVHVRYGREIIEVTTFRSHHNENEGKANESAQSADGMLLRDNVYGDIQSDAERRDFTINALYYDPQSGDILDHTRGMQDIGNRLLRVIGDPETRFKEDPVRMLRAVRFAAKLGFSIDAKTAAPIQPLAAMLDNIPSARLWDESLKLFMSGYATAIFHLLLEHNLFRHLFPGSAEQIDNPTSMAFFEKAMINTDKRIRADKRVTPAFIFAVLLWPAIDKRRRELMSEGAQGMQAFHTAQQQVLQRQINRIAIPKRFTSTMREIWDLQPALPRRAGKRAYRTLEHPRFRAAYDFLLLREEAGENHQGLGQWWTRFQSADEATREEMINGLQNQPQSRRRRSSSSRRGKSNSSSDSSSNPTSA